LTKRIFKCQVGSEPSSGTWRGKGIGLFARRNSERRGPRRTRIRGDKLFHVDCAPKKALGTLGKSNSSSADRTSGGTSSKPPFEAVERLLKSWNREEDGVVDVNALKELKINSERLRLPTDGSHALPQHWYDPDWPEPHESDLLLGEFSLDVPVRVRWSAGHTIVDAQVLRLYLC
jgi:hypothetical protein